MARGWSVCGLLFLATVLNYMDRTALNQMAGRVQASFGMDNARYGVVEGAFAAAFAVGALAAGVLVDRADVRWLYPLAVLGWSAAGFLTGSARTFGELLACRAVLGLFEAANWPCGVRVTRTVLRPEQRSLGNALFHSGTAVGAIVTPFIVLACVPAGTDDPDAWRLPFRVIGLAGVAWAVLWLVTVRVPLRHTPSAGDAPAGPFALLLRDRRFWVLALVICAVNSTWQSFRVWLPKFLAEAHGYPEDFVQWFSAGYYLAADLGSLAVGAATLALARRGVSLHTARLALFGVCAAGALLAVPVALVPRGPVLLGLILAVGFCALGLFPTYFALSQELSGPHQGKVTGTLGFVNAAYLALLFPLQGRLIDGLGGYGVSIATAGLPPAVALAALLVWWRR